MYTADDLRKDPSMRKDIFSARTCHRALQESISRLSDDQLIDSM